MSSMLSLSSMIKIVSIALSRAGTSSLRQYHRKRCSLPFRAFHFDPAAVRQDDLVNEGQSEPDSLVFGRKKRQKYLFEGVRSDTRAHVGYPQDQVPPCAPGDRKFAAVGHRLD